MEESLNSRHKHRVSRLTFSLVVVICLILALLLASCGPSAEELAAFQTVTAMAAFTPTPMPSPTPAGISPDQDLTAIIESAADGDVITLTPGVFTLAQGLNISKNLTLIGAGGDQTTITTNTPYQEVTTMLMFSGTGTLTFKGIKIEYAGSNPSAVLYMNSGNLVLEDCTVTGATLSSSGKQMGVISMDNDATAIIRNSRIAGSLNRIDAENPEKIPGGIFLAGTTKLNIEGSSIADSYLGVYAYGQAQVTSNNSQYKNVYSALTLLETATATVSGNTFSNCTGSCIVTLDDSQASISENTFIDSLEGLAIQVTENSKAQIEKNTLSNAKSAIIFMDTASGKAAGNTIKDFTNIGIYVQNASAPIITNNVISLDADNPEQAIGIVYQDSAAGEARGNQFSNLYLGISLKDNAAPLLDSNTIESCLTGIAYAGNASGTANLNVIQYGYAGILIESPASPVITNNTIQADYYAVSTTPEDWINQLIAQNNNLQEGPPIVTISTYTPQP